jgi:hypothetical protein
MRLALRLAARLKIFNGRKTDQCGVVIFGCAGK